MSYRSKRTRSNGDPMMQASIPTSDTLSKSTPKKPRNLQSKLDPKIRPTQGVCHTTSKEKMRSEIPPLGERSHKFTFPPHLDPSFVRLSQKNKPPVSANLNMEHRSQSTDMPQLVHQSSQIRGLSQKTQPHVSANTNTENTSQQREVSQIPPQPSQTRGLSQITRPSVSANTNMEKRSQPREVPEILPQPLQTEASPGLQATEDEEIGDGLQDDVFESSESGESDGEPLQQENGQDNLKRSKSAYARTMKSRSVAPNWPSSFNIDDKEDILTIDAEKNYKILSGSIQPRDIDNLDDGVKCVVNFNELPQPLGKSGDVLVKYLGSLAKIEKFCPIGAETWHHVNAIYKADIITRVREKFVIPEANGETFDKAILKHVGKFYRQYKHSLKKPRFLPNKRTKEQIINNVPHGHTKDNWVRLVEYWYSKKSQKLSSVVKRHDHLKVMCIRLVL